MCSMPNVTIGLRDNLISWNPWTIILNNLSINVQDPLTWLPPSLRIFRQVSHDKCTEDFLAVFRWSVCWPEFTWMRKKTKQFTLPIHCYSAILVFTILERRHLALEVQSTCMHVLVCIMCIWVSGCLFFLPLKFFFFYSYVVGERKPTRHPVLFNFIKK